MRERFFSSYKFFEFFSQTETYFLYGNMIASAGPSKWRENNCVLFGELVDGAGGGFFSVHLGGSFDLFRTG